jgi:hypothetical protein
LHSPHRALLDERAEKPLEIDEGSLEHEISACGRRLIQRFGMRLDIQIGIIHERLSFQTTVT